MIASVEKHWPVVLQTITMLLALAVIALTAEHRVTITESRLLELEKQGVEIRSIVKELILQNQESTRIQERVILILDYIEKRHVAEDAAKK